MESKEPKFNKGFEFLEDPKILELQKLIDGSIRGSSEPENREKSLAELMEKWDNVQNECIEKADTDDADIKNFLRFIQYNIRIMDKGGMNMGRSKISLFIDKKSEELNEYWDRFMESL